MAAANECTSAVCHFDGHGGAPVQYEAHRLMQHDQGFTGSHWNPSLGDNLLRITPAAARATINTTIMQNVPTMLAVLMAIAMHWYYTICIARRRRFVAFRKATKRCHWARTSSNRHQLDMPTPISGVYFIVKLLKKNLSCPNNNRDVTHQTDEKHLNNMSEYFVGVVNIVFNCYNNRFL